MKRMQRQQVGLGPTPERAAMADFAAEALTPDGKTVALRQVDSLAVLRRRGTITAAQARAGQMFRDDWAAFQRAMNAPALDPGKVRVDGGGAGWDPEPSRRGGRAWDLLGRLGGVHSLGGACLVKVVGEGMTVQRFAETEGWPGVALSPHAVKGALLVVLEALVGFYGMDRETETNAR